MDSLFFLAVLFRCVWSLSAVREFSKGGTASDTVTTIQGVSIATCKQECENRKRCNSAAYYRRYHRCVLMSQPRHKYAVVSSVGAVLLSGFHALNETELGTCDGNTCSPNETCTAIDTGLRVCQITECKNLPPCSGDVLGNIYTVGSRIIIKRSPSDMRYTCGANGKWIPDEPYDVIDCTDVIGPSGVYVNSIQHNIYCDMDTSEGHWLVFQRRQDGSENFLRNWTDYRNGFGEMTGEFWLGLETMFQILSIGVYELRVDMETFDGVKRYAEYSTFSISCEADNYRLNVTGYSGDAGDGLAYHNGMAFSTIDRDNDLSTRTCAIVYSGAWWYYKCYVSNLNGKYYPTGNTTTTYGDHIHWGPLSGFSNSLKKTEMKFRKRWNA